MNRSAITLKIALTFLGIILFFILFSLFVLNRMDELNQKSTEMEITWLPRVIAINAINAAIDEYRIDEALHVLSKSVHEMEQYERNMARLLREMANWRVQYEALISSDQERTLFQGFLKDYDEYFSAGKKSILKSRDNQNEEAALLLKKSGVLFDTLQEKLLELVELNKHGAIRSSHSGGILLQQVQATIIVIDIFVAIAGFILIMMMDGWMDQSAAHSITWTKTLKRLNVFSRLTITQKLRWAFLALAMLFAAFAGLSLNRIAAVKDQANTINSNWLPSIAFTHAINTATSDLRVFEALHILSMQPLEMQDYERYLEDLRQSIGHLRSSYEALISSREEREIYQDFSRKYDEYLMASTVALESSRRNNNELAASQLKKSGVIFKDMSADLLKLVEMNRQGAANAIHQGEVIFEISRILLFGASACVLILAIFFMLGFERMISKPLSQLTRMITQLAHGDLSSQTSWQNRHDEIGQIARAVSAIMATLEALTREALELIGAIRIGALSRRITEDRHPGEFGAIVTGMNQLIDLLQQPLMEIKDVMEQLAVGHLHERIRGDYLGDLRVLKIHVNHSLNALVELLSELGSLSEHLAQSDLTLSVAGDYQGDFLTLKTNINHGIGQIRRILETIAESTRHMAANAAQVVTAADQVAAQSAQQMKALDEMGSAVLESSAAVNQIAESTKEGERMAMETADLAKNGQSQLVDLITLIEQMAAEYARIEPIIGKMTSTSDKTHTLSLTAGLEATRAEAHGLNFGYLAQQIGKLTEDLTASARDLGTLVASFSPHVRQMVEATQHTRTLMNGITQATAQNKNAVQSISVGILQQSRALEWISEQMHTIQDSGQKNAAAAEEIRVTMHHLADQVRHTNDKVLEFKLI
jgi:methyl-accepting chemotaxis protein